MNESLKFRNLFIRYIPLLKKYIFNTENKIQLRLGLMATFALSTLIYLIGTEIFEYQIITHTSYTFYPDALSLLEFETIIPIAIIFMLFETTKYTLALGKKYRERWLKK